jgi:hypothetical protein
VARRWSTMTWCENFAGGDQGAEQVGVVIGGDTLQHRGDSFQAHAGVDLRLGQVLAAAVGELLPLHEDQVPDLHEAVAVLVGATRRPAGDMIAVVVEDLGVGAAGTGVAHGPEVLVQTHDLAVAEAGDLLPEHGGLVVAGGDGDHQPRGIKLQFLGDEPPRVLDRAFLEIVAEGEVPQHFEEGLVAAGVAHIVEVIMLAAGAHALLHRGRAGRGWRFGAGEIVLERHHAGVDEQQSRIVLRHQGSRRDDQVIAGFEIAQEVGADLVQARHGSKRFGLIGGLIRHGI